MDNWDKKPTTALDRMKEEKAINVANEYVEEVIGLSYVILDDHENNIDVDEAIGVKKRVSVCICMYVCMYICTYVYMCVCAWWLL